MTSSTAAVAAALLALSDGDRARARQLAAQAASEPSASRLATALADHLATGTGESVYDRPAAFEAFVRHGGNVGLYDAVSTALADRYDAWAVTDILDLGCGDGLAVGPALDRCSAPVRRLDLVEPSSDLLGAALARLGSFAGTVISWPMTAQQFCGAEPDRSWSLVQSTFALHTLAPPDRRSVLSELARRTDRLAIVEFDVAEPVDAAARAHGLAERYERGLEEYFAESASLGRLVGQGFLLPVLVGQLDPAAFRNTWEGPAGDWAELVAAAGFTDVQVVPLVDYWWSPAFRLTAGGRAGAGS